MDFSPQWSVAFRFGNGGVLRVEYEFGVMH